MLRVKGIRLAMSATTLFLQSSKGKVGQPAVTKSVASTSAVAPPRQLGTVLSFMHRRGYGFISALGHSAADVSDEKGLSSAAVEASGKGNASKLFFPRSSLDGGFYLCEGQTVSFEVRPVGQGVGTKGHTLSDNVELGGDPSKSLSVAGHIRLWDAASKKERPVTPIMLMGRVESWDAISGSGVIAELDLTGALHDDAPRFSLSLEDVDVVNVNELRPECFVRFCLEPGDRTAARRVIIDRAAERRRGGQSQRRSNPGVGDVEVGKATVSRSYGTVRETVDGRFGFILLDETGESIFFHMSNVNQEGSNVDGNRRASGEIKAGDVVSFILRDIAQGKHAGKRTCVDIKKCLSRAPPAASRPGDPNEGLRPVEEDDESIFDEDE